MRHIFCIDNNSRSRYPVPGDLISKRRGTPNFINIVLSVSGVMRDIVGEFVAVRSVRYGHTNAGNFKLVGGERSRSFKYRLNPKQLNWCIVNEYTPYENSALRDSIVKRLRDVDTAYRPPAEESNDADSDQG